ncbi:MAG TPA: aminotransferase class V-fold PLP-dependent enzyme [Vicinamibacterales bacterium]|nr:aminotransferase class V-fold PLP-dependent enzyme [Vicinamibacterales bacterium]
MSQPVGRRDFLARVALGGVAAGFLPSVAWARQFKPLDVPTFTPAAGASDEQLFAAARREFLFPADVTYGNTGTLGASPREVVATLTKGTERLERELPDWPYFQADGEPLTGYQPLVDIRGRVGSLINATGDEIALTTNATMGMSFLANGIDLAPGDEIVTTDQEHSGGIGGWQLRAKRHGIVVKQVPILESVTKGPDAIVAQFADAITPKTKVVMFSQITSGLGMLLPAKALCALAHDRGALAIVDGAQVLGQRRVDVKDLGCDAYVTSPHKWMLAPKGTGILYIRRSAQPRFWNTLASAAFDDDSTGAFRFMHYGTGSVPVVEALMAALDFMTRIGLERIERWNLAQANRLRDGLTKIPQARLSSPAERRFASAITTFAVAGKTGRELQDALWAKKIRVRAQGGDRGVRLSAHLYVSPTDIDHVLEVVSAMK